MEEFRSARQNSIIELFEERVAAAPDAPAVVFRGASLSFGELNSRANRAAGYLRALGVGPEVVAGICSRDPLRSLIWLLGVVKAEGVVLPLDGRLPEGRLGFMAADASARVILTDAAMMPAAGDWGPTAIDMDQAEQALPGFPDAAPARSGHAGALLYVVYTSGSTGTPKGIAAPAQTVGTAVSWMLTRTAPGLSCLQFASPGFDVAFQEIFGTLLSGGRLILIEQEHREDLTKLLHLINQEKPARACLSPAFLQQFAQLYDRSPDQPGISPGEISLREIFVSGDVLRISAGVRRFLTRLGNVRVENQYGPSETHHATSLCLSGDVTQWPDAPAIGTPVTGVRVYVLDQSLRRVPAGTTGEIYIAGEGVARGYVQQPALTSQRFIADPFSPTAGRRMYRTGDLGRWTARGDLEFLGRADGQIKIRGYRVEPSEAELALARHPQVAEVAVTARPDASGAQSLIAYLRPAGPTAPAADELREYLASQLPAYMLPAAFVLMDTLPLNTNGKVDRQALPDPPAARPTLTSTYQPPASPHEKIVHRTWADILALDSIGRHDNFFALGGHSLLATQITTRLSTAFGITLPVRTLFDNPTIHQLTEALTDLTQGDDVLVPLAGGDQSQPSSGQRRFWFLDQLVSHRAVYNAPSLWRIEGPLDRHILQKALAGVCRRHSVLRSRFEVRDGEPRQVIGPAELVQLDFLDLSQLTRSTALGQAVTLAEREVLRPFSLTGDFLFRVRLTRISDDDHLLLLTFHHSVIDGWSLGLFWRDLSSLYDAMLAGEAVPLAPLRLQYADYAAWQRSQLTDDAIARDLEFWRDHLDGMSPRIDLATDHPRPPVPSGHGAQISFLVPQQATVRLREIAVDNNATTFMVALAVYGMLLMMYSGDTDLAVGVPMSGRTRAEFEDLVGFFVNSVPLRIAGRGEVTFTDLLRRTREAVLAAHSHQQIPFENLVEALTPERDLSRNPFFQVWFDLHAESHIACPSALKVSPESFAFNTARFDLEMEIEERGDDMIGVLRYSTDLFEAGTAQRYVEYFLCMVDQVGRHPDKMISAIASESVTSIEGRTREIGGHANPSVYDLASRFEERVAAAPDAPAVVFRGASLSFGELNSRANRAAGYLRALGVGPEVVAGICSRDPLRSLIWLLGVVKAEGVVLPLDGRLPEGRLGFMAADASARVILTDAAMMPAAGDWGPTAIDMDQAEQALPGFPDAAPARSGHAGALLYVVYTSGSTGTPKGIAAPAQTVGTAVSWMLTRTAPGLSCLQFASPGFDVAFQEIFGTLLSGGRLILIEQEHREDLTKLLHLINQEKPARMYLGPVLLQQLAAAHENMKLSISMKELAVGGEQLRISAGVRRFLTRLGNVRVENQYGPSETHHATSLCLSGDVTQWPDAPAIGTPVTGVRVYVLDQSLRRVPAGTTGEIYIAGEGVARGYVQQPALTSQRFIADPFSPTAGRRMYRTGDLGRWTARGDLEFLGRADGQIKIRGYRVEPSEAELALARHPQVAEVAVTARPDASGAQSLIAYLRPAGPTAPAADELREYLASQLPAYMLPAAFVLMDTLPLNTNGKVDRQALPDPPAARPTLTSTYQPPASPHEKIVHRTWADILALDSIGRHDNFFALGGHSLLATQITTRLSTAFGITLPVRTLFDNPTIHQLTEAVELRVIADVTGQPLEETRSAERPA